MALALQYADPGQRAVLESGLGDRDADEATVAQMARIVAQTGARREVEEMIESAASQAEAAIADQRIDAASATVLRSLIAAATKRSN